MAPGRKRPTNLSPGASAPAPISSRPRLGPLQQEPAGVATGRGAEFFVGGCLSSFAKQAVNSCRRQYRRDNDFPLVAPYVKVDVDHLGRLAGEELLARLAGDLVAPQDGHIIYTKPDSQHMDLVGLGDRAIDLERSRKSSPGIATGRLFACRHWQAVATGPPVGSARAGCAGGASPDWRDESLPKTGIQAPRCNGNRRHSRSAPRRTRNVDAAALGARSEMWLRKFARRTVDPCPKRPRTLALGDAMDQESASMSKVPRPGLWRTALDKGGRPPEFWLREPRIEELRPGWRPTAKPSRPGRCSRDRAQGR